MVTIRQATISDSAAIARVQVEGWRSTYRGIVPDGFLDAIGIQVWTDRRPGEMADASLGLLPHVAEIEDDVVGWAMGGPNLEPSLHFSGELYAI